MGHRQGGTADTLYNIHNTYTYTQYTVPIHHVTGSCERPPLAAPRGLTPEPFFGHRRFSALGGSLFSFLVFLVSILCGGGRRCNYPAVSGEGGGDWEGGGGSGADWGRGRFNLTGRIRVAWCDYAHMLAQTVDAIDFQRKSAQVTKILWDSIMIEKYGT